MVFNIWIRLKGVALLIQENQNKLPTKGTKKNIDSHNKITWQNNKVCGNQDIG